MRNTDIVTQLVTLKIKGPDDRRRRKRLAKGAKSGGRDRMITDEFKFA